MSSKRVFSGVRASSFQALTRRGLATMAFVAAELLAAGSAPALASGSDSSSSVSHCAAVYDPSASYPGLSELEGPDVSSAGVVLYLHQDHAVAELEGCFYRVDRALEIDFGSLDFVTLLFEFPDHGTHSQMLVSDGGERVEVLDLPTPSLDYVVRPGEKLGFVYGASASAAPTTPVIVTSPPDNPEPE